MTIELVTHAQWTPGCCMICGRHLGEMIDTGIVIPGDGRMYLCVEHCVPIMAALIGQRETPKQKCSATKANGEPCSADALPGRDLCVSHLKVQQQKEEAADALAPV